MNNKLNLIIIEHGVENIDDVQGYANPLIDGIKKYHNRDNSVFFSYDWNREAQQKQLMMYEAVEKGLWGQKIRKLKHTMFGDTAVCRRSKNGRDYLQKMADDIDSIIFKYINLGFDLNIHLIGHSQGSQNLLDYCFDSSYKERITGLITLGSIISAGSWIFNDWGHVPDDPHNGVENP